MANLISAIGIFLVLLLASATMVVNFFKSTGLPHFVTDTLSGFALFFKSLVNKNETSETGNNFSLTIAGGTVEIDMLQPTDLTLVAAKDVVLDIDELTINITEQEIEVLGFKGNLLLSPNSLSMRGEFAGLNMRGLTAKRKKGTLSIERAELNKLTVERASARVSVSNATGSLVVGNTRLELRGENIEITEFAGKLLAANEAIILEGKAERIKVGERVLIS